MTDVTLQYARPEATELVMATFETMSSVRSYEVEEDGRIIVGIVDGGFTSFGEEVIVALPEDPDAASETTISVTAQPRIRHNISANPWKYKSKFLDQLSELEGNSVDELSESTPDREKRSSESTGGTRGERPGDTSTAMVVGAKLMLLLLLGMLVLLTVVAGVATILSGL